MSLSDFVHYLNSHLPFPSTASRSTTPFVSEDNGVLVYFSNIRLESSFSTIIDSSSGELCGHVARLSASERKSRRPINSQAVFDLPSDHGELVFLDRLVRTLHTINYLIHHERHSRSLLLLKVHPRHVASVATDHGLAFQEILRACDLLPEQITLELDIDGVEDTAHLLKAVANYRSRGYGIAVGRVGQHEIDFALLNEIRPSLVKLDSWLLNYGEPVRPLIDQLHDLGAKVLIEGLNTKLLRDEARDNGFDFLQAPATEGNLRQA